jgi:hypothetical protein
VDGADVDGADVDGADVDGAGGYGTDGYGAGGDVGSPVVVVPVVVVVVVVPGGVVGEVLKGPISNQSLLREKSAANSLPVKPTEPELPITDNLSTRPPIWPRPLRAVTSIACRLPMEGSSDWISLTGIVAVQAWKGLAGTESPRSTVAGKAPPAV